MFKKVGIHTSALPWPIFSNDFPSELIPDAGGVKVFTRDSFSKNIKIRRREFVNNLFPEKLVQVFKMLEDDSHKHDTCHREVTFDIPPHYDYTFIERVLCNYFSDCGYTTLTEPSKTPSNKIIITLT